MYDYGSEFLDLLERLRKSIQGLIQSIAIREKAAEREREIEIQRVREVAVRLPVEVSEYYKSEQDDRPVKDLRERVKLRVEIAGFIIACALVVLTFITAVVFYLQLRESRRQTAIFKQQATQATMDAEAGRRQSDQQFRTDQRPIVWLANMPNPVVLVGPIPSPAGSKQIAVDVSYANLGKSAAYGLRAGENVWAGKMARIQATRPTIRSQPVFLPPNRIDFRTLVTPPVSDATIQESNGDDGVIFWLRFHYEDSIGNPYETDLCMQHLARGPWSYCTFPGSNNIQDCANPKATCEKQ
jgi:hypothetical protein